MLPKRTLQMRTALAFVCLLALPAGAQEWNVRPWDTRLTLPEIRELVVGREIAFPDGAVARYGEDGSYAYVYSGGRTFEGTYEMVSDGALCVTFEGGRSRCDLYVLQGDRLMLINEAGGRFLTAP